MITLSVQGAIRLAEFESGADCVLVLDLPPASLRPAALPAPLSIPRQVRRSFPEAGRVHEVGQRPASDGDCLQSPSVASAAKRR